MKLIHTYQSRIDVSDCQELLIALMDLFMLQPALFKVSVREVKKCITTQDAANGAFKDVGNLIVEDFGCVCVLVGKQFVSLRIDIGGRGLRVKHSLRKPLEISDVGFEGK